MRHFDVRSTEWIATLDAMVTHTATVDKVTTRPPSLRPISIRWRTKAGVMIRETLNANSRQVHLGLTPGVGSEFLRRTFIGASFLLAHLRRLYHTHVDAAGAHGQYVHGIAALGCIHMDSAGKRDGTDGDERLHRS